MSDIRLSGSTPPPSDRSERRRRSDRRRESGRHRWLRLAGPFAVLLTLWIFTSVAHVLEEPDLGDPGTLSPAGDGADGSSVLAELLAARGVQVERVTSGQQAVAAARADDDVAVFVPTPRFLSPDFLTQLAETGRVRRTVVVQPGPRTIYYSPVQIFPVDDRWATAVVAPACPAQFAVQAGPAAVLNHRYEFTGGVYCYSGGLVSATSAGTEFVYVGASDPFRNGRIGEVGNAALSVALLSQHRRLIWVDVHHREPQPRPEIDLPTLPPYRREDQDRGATGYPLIDAFPSWLWAGLIVAAVCAILLALARARRLGAPVAEPLPVLVPAAETVTGRGRLYARIHARAAALTTLRAASISRLARMLYPAHTSPPERDLLDGASAAATDLIHRASHRTGQPAEAVRGVLYGPSPADDAELRRAVADLDALVGAVLRSSDQSGGTP